MSVLWVSTIPLHHIIVLGNEVWAIAHITLFHLHVEELLSESHRTVWHLPIWTMEITTVPQNKFRCICGKYGLHGKPRTLSRKPMRWSRIRGVSRSPKQPLSQQCQMLYHIWYCYQMQVHRQVLLVTSKPYNTILCNSADCKCLVLQTHQSNGPQQLQRFPSKTCTIVCDSVSWPH